MSRKYKFGDSDKLYFISFAVVNWIDVFVRKEYNDIVLDSWRFCQHYKGLNFLLSNVSDRDVAYIKLAVFNPHNYIKSIFTCQVIFS